ncbi:acyl carrier protein [Actinospica durhamensis]|uniref:Acyl carrier protein n=1 Tax=Actinospica durhamensis TaxID=1508375 RepID=A0A941EJ98_9ACTN|nr:acyl carrier protein [Actinospica durhamensis]MBR7831775.1 acyl carrier protein [Actinospica durhamensis]
MPDNDASSVATMITRFILETKGPAALVEFSDDTELIDGLGFDSVDLVSFMAWIENWTGSSIPDSDYSIGNFSTVGAVRRYIAGGR